MRRVLLAVALAAMALPALGDPDAVFRVDFSNPQISPSHWTITLYPDGSGHFHSERGSTPAADPPTMEAPNVDRDIRLSEPFAGRVFQTARLHSNRSEDCESHMKVAFQGWKKLSYTGPGGQWTCEFNYSRDKQVQALGDSMMGVAATLLEGARLEMLLQHDRLGLDREMEYIVEGLGDGRLVQISAIQGILERLADDPGVMERVRKRARTLLASAEK
jgi:hypothetical protein